MPLAIVYFGLVLARIGSFVAAFPLFAPRTPRTVRVSLTLVLAIFFVTSCRPGWQPVATEDLVSLSYLLALLREAFIGVTVGLVFGLFLMPARVAGEFVTHQMGLANSQQHGITDGGATAIVPQVFETAAGILFLGLDGHHVVLAALNESFVKAPLGGSLVIAQSTAIVGSLSSAHEMGLMISAPLALSLFLLSLALAMTARAAPQLNIHSIGFTLQVIIALVGFLFFLPELMHTLSVAIERMQLGVRGLWG